MAMETKKYKKPPYSPGTSKGKTAEKSGWNSSKNDPKK